MTKTATLTPDKPTDLRAAFGFHAVPFTREITTDHHLRLPFLDEALAGLLSTALARMSAALIAPAGTCADISGASLAGAPRTGRRSTWRCARFGSRPTGARRW